MFTRERPRWRGSSLCNDTEIVTRLPWDLALLVFKRGGKYSLNFCRCWLKVNMPLCFFLPYFSLRTSPGCARVGGPAYVHTCVVSGSRGTAGVLASSLETFFKPLCTRSGPGSALFFIFSFRSPSSLPHVPALCRECRIGTDEPSYGGNSGTLPLL